MKRTAWSTAAVVLGLSMLVPACRGEEKGKPARAPAARPQAKPAEAPPPPPQAPQPAEKAAGKVVKQVATGQGQLKVLRHGTGAAAEYSVVLGERELVEPRLGSIDVAAVRSKPARLVLLRLRGTVKACPALFRVVEAPKGKDLKVSDEFGNCSPRPRASSVASGWKISFPRYGKAAAKAWMYAGGEVQPIEPKKASTRAARSKAAPRAAPSSVSSSL